MSDICDDKRYVPAEKEPDEVRFYYMHDNHTFTALLGATLDEVLAAADKVEASSSYGMLCAPLLLSKNNEVRRLRCNAHSGSSKDSKDKWGEGKAAWLAECESDSDVMRLVSSNG